MLGLTGNSNCTRCRLEIGDVFRGQREAPELVFTPLPSGLVEIRWAELWGSFEECLNCTFGPIEPFRATAEPPTRLSHKITIKSSTAEVFEEDAQCALDIGSH